MYKNKSVLGIILARGGSKGIPRKNIKNCNGKPLIAYTIEAVQNSQYLDHCIVSTDDEEIAQIAKSFGALVPFMRPDELASDTATGIDATLHAYNWVKDNEKTYDYCMILQPTSPLRTGADIDEAIKIAVDNDADSVMSMYKLSDMSFKKLKHIKDGRVIDAYEPEGKTTAPRTEDDDLYKRNCAIYLTKAEVLLRGELFGEKQFAYIMPPERSVDINEPLDFTIAECLLKST